MTTVAGASRSSRPSSTAHPDHRVHTVKSGETLGGIARQHKVTLAAVLKANPQIKDADLIRVGQDVRIPERKAAAPQQPAEPTPPKKPAPNKPPRSGGPAPTPGKNTVESALPRAPQANLERGDKGPQVKKLQDALVKLGHMTRATQNTGPGIFGPATEDALQSFQREAHLKADGVYGPRTRAALEKALQGKPAPADDGPRPSPGRPTKPPVTQAPSPNQSSRGGTDVDTIVLHHTGTNNGAGDISWLRNPRSQVSAHYVVDTNGKIYQLVPDDKKAWHAGTGGLPGKPNSDVNARSIGIEIVNDGNGGRPFTEAQYKALEKLVPYLAVRHNVPDKHILGHKDVARPAGRKSDPADDFNWGRIRRAVDAVR